jgi:hypothetical protein
LIPMEMLTYPFPPNMPLLSTLVPRSRLSV